MTTFIHSLLVVAVLSGIHKFVQNFAARIVLRLRKKCKLNVCVATMMVDTDKSKRDDAMKGLEKIGEKRKLLGEKPINCWTRPCRQQQALPKIRAKLRLPSLLKEPKNSKHWTLLVTNSLCWFYCMKDIW